MEPQETAPTASRDRQLDLLARLQSQVEAQDAATGETDPYAIPGSQLVSTVGQLALVAPDAMLPAYRQLLWPGVRRVLGIDTPGPLLVGDYDALCQQAEDLLSEGHDSDARLAASVRRASDRRDASARLQWLDAWEEHCVTLFVNRLGIGFFLTGLQELWPEEGSAAARILWRSGRVAELDDLLEKHRARFERVQGRVVRLLEEQALVRDNCWLAGVRLFVGEPAPPTAPASAEPAPRYLLPVAEMLKEALDREFPERRRVALDDDRFAETETASDLDSIVLQVLLVSELLHFGLGASAPGATWNVGWHERSGLVRAVSPIVEVGFWFPDSEDEVLTVHRLDLERLDLLLRGETVSLALTDPEGDSAVDELFVLVLNGVLVPYLLSSVGEDDSLVTVAQQEFSGDADQTRTRLIDLCGLPGNCETT
jgi:hypothetical protein